MNPFLRAIRIAQLTPDIIMLGEIRDQETAIMAIQSALTGHLVFSTLHTNDAASAVTSVNSSHRSTLFAMWRHAFARGKRCQRLA